MVRGQIRIFTEKYANEGYAYVEINPETNIDSKTFSPSHL
jgi:outer membrane protein assembly factor BamA